RYSPSREYTFCSAFSRTLQELSRMTSASCGLWVGRIPCCMSWPESRWLSSSFIWQPQVSMKKRRMVRGRVEAREGRGARTVGSERAQRSAMRRLAELLGLANEVAVVVG